MTTLTDLQAIAAKQKDSYFTNDPMKSEGSIEASSTYTNSETTKRLLEFTYAAPDASSSPATTASCPQP